MRVLGLMSGTSYDAIEAALADITLEGDTLVLVPVGASSHPYPDGLADQIAAALPPADTTMAHVCRLDTLIGQAFATVAEHAVADLGAGQVDAVVSHGQTFYHWVEDGVARGTLQLGQPAWIAERTGLPVIADVRSRDVAAGGQGAPLVSRFDTLLLADGGRRAALNLGGIANVTVVGDDVDGGERTALPIAFDTGPANALLDAVVVDRSGGQRRFDADGAGAAAGVVRTDLLEVLLAEPYYAAVAPKSTGKELFHLDHVRTALAALDGPAPSEEDLLATLTRLTARTVADALRPYAATEVVVSGGGTRNPTLMAALDEELGEAHLREVDELGVPSSAKEAYAFAVLGWLTLHGVPGSVASCTGARGARVLGSVVPGSDGSSPARPTPELAPRRLRVDPTPAPR